MTRDQRLTESKHISCTHTSLITHHLATSHESLARTGGKGLAAGSPAVDGRRVGADDDQLGQIVGYVEQLAELNTDDVAADVASGGNVQRVPAGRTAAQLDRAAMLANSPHSDGEYYLVPAVLGD